MSAKWLYAISTDRWLYSAGKPQRYGTQFLRDGKGCNTKLYEVDPATTDAERAALDVPTLAQAKAWAETFNAPTCNK